MLVIRPAGRDDAARAGQAADAAALAGLATRAAAALPGLGGAAPATGVHDAAPQAAASTRQVRTGNGFKDALLQMIEHRSVHRMEDALTALVDPADIQQNG